jgi:hypothetical protein
MQLFIGLTFYQDQLHYQKIDYYRQRFDEKFSRSSELPLSLLPPFIWNGNSRSDEINLYEHLQEDIEDQLLHGFEECRVEFKGIDFRAGNKGHVFLRPTFPTEMFHCQEVLRDMILLNNGHFKKNKNTVRSSEKAGAMLPIARTQDLNLLNMAVETAKNEFSESFHLRAKDITIFEKLPGEWIARKILFTFVEDPNTINYDDEYLWPKFGSLP